jgi:hypothetical protein
LDLRYSVTGRYQLEFLEPEQLTCQCPVVARAGHKDDRLSRWVTGIATRRHPNVAVVALANKTARMAWAMLRNETDYDPGFAIR